MESGQTKRVWALDILNCIRGRFDMLEKSRILKAITDGQDVDFDDAGYMLSRVAVAVLIDSSICTTASAQAAVLTAVATSVKCFGRCYVVGSEDIPLAVPFPGSVTLFSAAESLGAKIERQIPKCATHLITCSQISSSDLFSVRCWWDRWGAGVLPAHRSSASGESWNPLSGVFSGALAVREVFANVVGKRGRNPRESRLSLWEPWVDLRRASDGPEVIYWPKKIWVAGLGHLGQGFLWNWGFLDVDGASLTLQDYQRAGAENLGTGLLTRSSDLPERKTRIAGRWMEALGWETQYIERKIGGSGASHAINREEDDPQIIVSGLDDVIPRQGILRSGFAYFVDAGVGRGPVDFESVQLRVLKKGARSSWKSESDEQERRTHQLLQSRAYQSIASTDQCGAFEIADASVAVPFVGAAVGALTTVQVLRIAGMHKSPKLMRVDFSSPDFAIKEGFNSTPERSVGCLKIRK